VEAPNVGVAERLVLAMLTRLAALASNMSVLQALLSRSAKEAGGSSRRLRYRPSASLGEPLTIGSCE
jgi:hypothetical protein